jgi:hypothetical protein
VLSYRCCKGSGFALRTKEKGRRMAGPCRSKSLSTRLIRAGDRYEYRDVLWSGPRPSAESCWPSTRVPQRLTTGGRGPRPRLPHGAGAARRFASCWRSLRHMATGSLTAKTCLTASSSSSHLSHGDGAAAKRGEGGAPDTGGGVTHRSSRVCPRCWHWHWLPADVVWRDALRASPTSRRRRSARAARSRLGGASRPAR